MSPDEMTPEDFSVWHPGLNASIPMEYLGSQMSFGKGEAISCVKGFDNAGFVHV
jgi:lysophospholipase